MGEAHPARSVDDVPIRYGRRVMTNRPVTLFPTSDPEVITSVTHIRAGTWTSRAAYDRGATWPLRALVIFSGGEGVFGSALVIDDRDGRWEAVLAELDGYELDIRRILPRLIRLDVGKVARAILAEGTNGHLRPQEPSR